MATSFFDAEGKAPEKVQRLMQKAFARPDAREPVSKGALFAMQAMLMGAVVSVERHMQASDSTRLTTMSTLVENRIQEITKTVAEVEKRFATFHPLIYVGRECGTRSTRMEMSSGHVVTITTVVERAERGTLKREASRVDRLGERVDQLACRLDSMAAALKALADVAGVGLALGLADRGVFKVGEAYRRGEWTTHQGSLWICNVESTTDKPGTSTAWRLAVKSGRDGRDAIGQH